ncbi:MAG TPA: integrin alpha [Gaiellaceae bacterium]|nr:integrin alpha [Gaiellaceae bacterium]
MAGRRKKVRFVLVAAIALLGAATAAFAAGGTFLEPDVHVVRQFDGEGSQSFGWAVSPVAAPGHRHRLNALVSEAFNGPNLDRGSAFLYSSRTGELIRRWDGSAGDWFAFSVADAGDVDGDRANDILLGAPAADAAHGPGYLDLVSGRTGRVLHRFVGEEDGDAFGWAAASAGDVDGDRRPDILIGASAYHTHGNEGRAYIYSGRTYELLRTLEGDAVGDEFGSGVGWTEDVNGDRVPDQIVGAREALAPDGRPRGKVYVYSGRTGERLYTIAPSALGVQFGSFFVAGIGDVNRDRTPDIYVGDYSDRTNGVEAGRAAVFSGRDGSELHAWLGEEGEGLGPGRGAGDVNHDGRQDVIVGSYMSSAGAPQAGKVEIFSGADASLLRTITSTTAGENLGFDAVGLGDVTRDGVPDALLAAATGDHVYIVAGVRHGNDD